MSKETEAKAAAEAKTQEEAAKKAKEEEATKAARDQQKKEAEDKAAAEAKTQESDEKDAKIMELTNRIKVMEEAAKREEQSLPDTPMPQKSARQRYEELKYNATVVYECDGPNTRTVDDEAEVVKTRLQPSCTKKHWEEMPRWEKGARKGQPTHLENAKLIGFIENGELVEL